jgi:pSer/pThr/pTyr-binding forkhead associated (FHA) protein
MDSARASFEPTTTLHLGLRTVSELPSNAIDALIDQSNAEERAVIEAVIQGQDRNAMVFIHRGPSKGARFLVTPQGSTIGRAPTADIFLDDVTVSRSHARIEFAEDGYRFIDAGSLNGSYINNEPASSHLLHSGDEIQIGKFHMIFIGASQSTIKN